MVAKLLSESPVGLPGAPGPHRVEDYLARPDEPRCELIYGRFYVTPSPTLEHQVLVRAMLRAVEPGAEAVGAVAVAAPLDVQVGDHSVVQPDVVVYSAAEGARRWRQQLDARPDLVIEILSPSTGRRDRGEKLSLYAQLGVVEYWIVDPATRHVEFLVLRGDRFEVRLPDETTYRSDALPWLSLDLDALWAGVDARRPAD